VALLELKRSLLLPAILIAASLTLVGCSAGSSDTNNSSNNSSSSSDDDEDEEEAEEEEEVSAGGCPASFLSAFESTAAEGAEVSLITADEFSAPEIGEEYLEDGCLFRVVVEVDGSTGQSDFGYLPGDADTVAAISANLDAAGFENLAEGMYSKSDTFGVFVLDSADSMSAEEVDKLGLDFGDSFVIVMATTSGA